MDRHWRTGDEEESQMPKAREIIGRNLPHLTIVDTKKEEGSSTATSRYKISLADNFFTPADPYANFSVEFNCIGFSGFCENPGFWGIPCSRLSLFPDKDDE